MAAIKLGVGVLFTDLGVEFGELVSAAEEAGLESLFLTEHTHIPVSRRDVLDMPGHSRDDRILDQFTVLGAAAALGSRLRLGTGICVIPQRDPIILARQVATIDHLSGGRFLFGVGAGWLVEELLNHGVEPALRWDVMGGADPGVEGDLDPARTRIPRPARELRPDLARAQASAAAASARAGRR